MRLMRLLISMMAMVHHCTGELARATCSAPHNNTVLGDRANTFRHNRSGSFEDCCVMCAGSATPPRCVAFTFEPGTGSSPGVCFLKSSGAPVAHKPGARSGTVAAPPTTPPLPPPPPPPGNVTAVVSVSRGPELNRIDDGFKTWNIDASPNRGWDRRDLSNPTLRSLGRLSRPGYLRFGGAGNDGLNYALDMAAPGSTGNGCAAGASRCLNRTWVDNLCGFAEASGARLVFGLNVNVRKGTGAIGDGPGEGVWDPAEARAMIKYAIGANHSFWGFELGNEQNWRYSPAASAADFAILRDLLTELFPDAATRPKIVGPDCHGLHNDPNGPGDGRDKAAIRYLAEFISNCTALGVPLHAVTHHEYVDVDPDPSAPATANQLDVTGQIASAMVAGLAGSRARALPAVVQLWAGEIGPHNGGTVPCDHTSMRWANWGDTFWYLDAMATKAARGYSVFCRQDFVGIDYGMIDCETCGGNFDVTMVHFPCPVRLYVTPNAPSSFGFFLAYSPKCSR